MSPADRLRATVLFVYVCGFGCAGSQRVSPAVPSPAVAPAVGQPVPAAPRPDPVKDWAGELASPDTCADAFARLGRLPLEELRPLLPLLADRACTEAKRHESCPGAGERRAEYLQVIARLEDPATIPLFIEALAFDDEVFDHAVVAANFLRAMKATAAVDALAAAAIQRLPIKSRANNVRLMAIRALTAIADPRAVPALMQVLTTSADEQDFLLNVKAALALGTLADPRAVPALIQGMFMTGRGTNIFPECRLALVQIGAPAVPALVSLLDPASAESVALIQRLRLEGSDVAKLPERAAMVLSALGDRATVPALVDAYRRPAIRDDTPKPAAVAGPAYRAWLERQQPTHEHTTILMALGLIGGDPARRALLSVLRNAKAPVDHRTAAAEALAWGGDVRAIGPLLAVATSSPEPIEGERDLRVYAATSAMHLASLGELAKVRQTVDALARKNPKAEGLSHAQASLAVLEKCAGDLPCLGQALDEPPAGLADAAVFALAHAKDRKAALPFVVDHLVPLADLTPALFQRRMVSLFAIRRLGDRTSTDAVDKLERLVERDESSVRLPGTRDLHAETRITAAVLRGKE